MSAQIDKVLNYLDQHGIKYSKRDHPPVATIEESKAHWQDLDGMHCKNLFMRDHKGKTHYLIVADAHKPVDIKSLNALLSDRLSFASSRRMEKYLDLTPGSVSPFGLINDQNGEVILILDATIKDADAVNFHPNLNTSTLTLDQVEFKKYLDTLSNHIRYVEL